MSTSNQDQPDLLQSFLATSEARCPVCGYNLHAATSGTCPECGHRPRLGLVQRDGLGRRRGLLLLVFAWLMLAGAMNGYTGARSIHTTITKRPQVLTVLQSQPFVARMIEVDRSRIGDGLHFAETVHGEADADVEEAIEVVCEPAPAPDAEPAGLEAQAAATTAIEHTASFRLAAGSAAPAMLPSISFDTGGMADIVPMSSATSLTWSSVRWTQWTTTAWWIVLATVALAALIVLLKHRRREASRRLATALLTTAWIAFGGYFAYHVVRFVGDVA